MKHPTLKLILSLTFLLIAAQHAAAQQQQQQQQQPQQQQAGQPGDQAPEPKQPEAVEKALNEANVKPHDYSKKNDEPPPPQPPGGVKQVADGGAVDVAVKAGE